VRLDFVYLQNVVCSSVGTVAASVRLLYILLYIIYPQMLYSNLKMAELGRNM